MQPPGAALRVPQGGNPAPDHVLLMVFVSSLWYSFFIYAARIRSRMPISLSIIIPSFPLKRN
jgi:hypothetical protein